MPMRSGERAANGEWLRNYLDLEIGRVAMGEPVASCEEISRATGLSRQDVFYAERSALRKIGAAIREGRLAVMLPRSEPDFRELRR